MAEAQHFARLLGANPFFAGLGSDAIDAVASRCVSRSVAAGETLFQKGDAADALYAVRRGQIQIVTGHGDGRRMTLNILGSGDVFGEVAVLDGRPRTADAVALEAAELFMVRRRDIIDLVGRHPDMRVRLIELLCERLRWTSERLEEWVFLPVAARLARRLVALAEDFGADLRVSQEELAVYVGASREKVNRQLQEWRRKGYVELGRGRVTVVDPEALGAEDGSGEVSP